MMNQQPEGLTHEVLLTHKGRRKHCSGPWIATGYWKFFVCNQLRLHNDAYGGINRLYLVTDGGNRSLSERYHTHRRYLNSASGGRTPIDAATKHPVAQIKFTLMTMDLAVANIKGLVIHKQT